MHVVSKPSGLHYDTHRHAHTRKYIPVFDFSIQQSTGVEESVPVGHRLIFQAQLVTNERANQVQTFNFQESPKGSHFQMDLKQSLLLLFIFHRHKLMKKNGIQI